MADIDLERKESVGIWWWVLGLVAIAAIAYLLADGLRDDRVATGDPTAEPVVEAPAAPLDTETEAAPAQSAGAVQAYQETCTTREPAEMGRDHEYTSQCALQLVDAVDAVVAEHQISDDQVNGRIDEARTAANNLSESAADETQHARLTREAFTSIAALIEDVERTGQPDGTGRELTQAAESINPDGPLLEQREQVQQFFSAAGESLERMAAIRPGMAI